MAELEVVVAQLPTAVCVLDRELRVLGMSPAWRKAHGPVDESVLGRSHYELYPDLGAEVRESHRRGLAGEVVRSDRAEVVSPDGTRATFSWEVRPWRTGAGELGGIVISCEDLTSRLDALDRLQESEERLRQLSEAINEVFWMTDIAKGRILFVNRAYEVIWGRSREHLYENPMSWLEAIHPEDRPRVQRAAMNQASGGYDLEYRIVRPDGTMRWIHDRAAPVLDPAGNAIRVAGLASDITERRSLEAQLRQAQKLEAVGQLAGGIAHDFNNSLREVAGAADRAASLTQQLLVFSRRQPSNMRAADLDEIVANAGRLLARILPESVTLEVRRTPGPIHVEVDPSRIEQVILNLAINARDAMAAGGRLVVETRLRDGGVELSVADEGEGIAPDDLGRIFDPFFTTKPAGQGTGLGLATVHGIVSQHGGTISVASTVGRGTTFRVWLPLRAASLPPAPRLPPPPREEHGRTILVVEDDRQVRRLTRRILEGAGYRVAEAANGVEALELWSAEGAGVALVLTDVVMPGGLSGLDLANRLRERRADLPVVFTSGYTADVAGAFDRLHEGVDYLPKPFVAPSLLAIVSRALVAATAGG